MEWLGQGGGSMGDWTWAMDLMAGRDGMGRLGRATEEELRAGSCWR